MDYSGTSYTISTQDKIDYLIRIGKLGMCTETLALTCSFQSNTIEELKKHCLPKEISRPKKNPSGSYDCPLIFKSKQTKKRQKKAIYHCIGGKFNMLTLEKEMKQFYLKTAFETFGKQVPNKSVQHTPSIPPINTLLPPPSSLFLPSIDQKHIILPKIPSDMPDKIGTSDWIINNDSKSNQEILSSKKSKNEILFQEYQQINSNKNIRFTNTLISEKSQPILPFPYTTISQSISNKEPNEVFF
jgi:hypothetical protein